MNQLSDSIIITKLSNFVSEKFWLKPDRPIFIYGTGIVGRDVWQMLTAKKIPVTNYMDHRFKENTLIDGSYVIQPDSSSIPNKARAVIILAIHNREVNMQELIDRLKSLGYSHFISMIDLYDHFSAKLGNRYWLSRRTFYLDNEKPIADAYALWTDDLSREIYSKTLEFRLTSNYSVLPLPDREHQYFPPDLPSWKAPIRMIDCGAYDGDTIRNFGQNGYVLSALAAFEPDLRNYASLSKFIRETGKTIPEVSLWPCGVHASTRQLYFTSGESDASRIKDTGKTMIQCVSLDDAVTNFAPTLIKMDIEGAEYDALLGSRNLIATYQPGLAISIYHTPAHLWEIPLWVAQFATENKLGYTYHLRSHAYNCFDTVFYAIPIT